MNEEYNATQQPALEDKSFDHRNIFLRFANTTFYWLLFSYGQYAWRFFLKERFFGEPPERLFVDFCTIAKISVIVLDEKYHGYYLHCRSPHQYADGTMTELVRFLYDVAYYFSIMRCVLVLNSVNMYTTRILIISNVPLLFFSRYQCCTRKKQA